MSPVPLATRAFVLSTLWIEHSKKPEFADFIKFNDLGLPLAYCVYNKIVETNDQVDQFINSAFDELQHQLGFDDLDQYVCCLDFMLDVGNDETLETTHHADCPRNTL